MKTWRDLLSAALQANNENWTYINARTFIDGECDIPVTEPFRFVVWTARFVYVNNAEGGPEPVRVIPRNPPTAEDVIEESQQAFKRMVERAEPSEPSIWDGCEKPGAHQAASSGFDFVAWLHRALSEQNPDDQLYTAHGGHIILAALADELERLIRALRAEEENDA